MSNLVRPVTYGHILSSGAFKDLTHDNLSMGWDHLP